MSESLPNDTLPSPDLDSGYVPVICCCGTIEFTAAMLPRAPADAQSGGQLQGTLLGAGQSELSPQVFLNELMFVLQLHRHMFCGLPDEEL
jgi:hypothetical protein